METGTFALGMTIFKPWESHKCKGVRKALLLCISWRPYHWSTKDSTTMPERKKKAQPREPVS
jgi:hypothetical protein